MIRTVIIDDERGVRNVIAELLQRTCPNVEVIGEANSVETAVALIQETQPDLVLLDVQMPGGSGFTVLESVDRVGFKVIFITAFDQYALKAIKFSAMDYLLKPLNSAELIAAIAKYDATNKGGERVDGLIANIKSAPQFQKLAVPSTGKIAFLTITKIVRCEADGAYTLLYPENAQRVMSSKPIKEYEELLSDHFFFRIHRSHLINLKMVNTYTKGNKDIVEMKDGSKIEVSRKRRTDFISAMAQV
jgi:two-component system LytT family response regulator